MLMAVLMAFQMPVARVSAAGDPYISDLQIVTAKDANDAKSKVGNDYKVVQNPLTEPNPKATEPYERTFLCYKTTDKKEEAIYDIKTVEMNDGYSYSKYAKYLEDMEDSTEKFIKSLAPAIREFQQNYNKGGELTLIAYDILDHYYENDSEMSVADLLTYVEFDKKGNLKEDSIALLTPLFMQSSMEVSMTIQNLILVSLNDSNESTWLEFLDEYTTTMCRGGKEFVVSKETEYKDEVKLFKQTIPEIQSDIKYYLKCEQEHPCTEAIEAEAIKQQKTFEIERAKAENDEMTDVALRKAIAAKRAAEDPNGIGAEYRSFYLWKLNEGADRHVKWETGKKLYDGLKAHLYPLNKYESIYDLIMADPDETDKEDYYAMMWSMTAGQRALLTLGADVMLSTAVTDADFYLEQFNTLLEDKGIYEDDWQFSVYDGIDRSLYDADGIAMTEHALEYLQYGTESPFDKTLDERVHNALNITSYVVGGLAIAGALTLVIGTFACAACSMTFQLPTYGLALESILTDISISSPAVIVMFVTLALLVIFFIIIVVNNFLTISNKTYVPVPRVICSKEDNLFKGIDSDGRNVFGDGYAYYYGVKNPTLGDSVKDVDGTEIDTGNHVMDVYGWQLEGTDRRWIALYYSKDARLAYMDSAGGIHRLNPIKAGSLAVSAERNVSGSPVSNFKNTVTNLMFWYQRSHNTLNDTPDSYLYKIHYTDEEFNELTFNSGSASVFADNEPLAFGGGGLVLGAIGGTFVTLAAKKKKKTAAEEQA